MMSTMPLLWPLQRWMRLRPRFSPPKFVAGLVPGPALVPEPVPELVPVFERLVGFDFVLIQFRFAVHSIGFVAEKSSWVI